MWMECLHTKVVMSSTCLGRHVLPSVMQSHCQDPQPWPCFLAAKASHSRSESWVLVLVWGICDLAITCDDYGMLDLLAWLLSVVLCWDLVIVVRTDTVGTGPVPENTKEIIVRQVMIIE